MYTFFKQQSSILLAELLPNTYYRSYIVYSSVSHYHWDSHPVMVTFPYILIPNAAVE